MSFGQNTIDFLEVVKTLQIVPRCLPWESAHFIGMSKRQKIETSLTPGHQQKGAKGQGGTGTQQSSSRVTRAPWGQHEDCQGGAQSLSYIFTVGHYGFIVLVVSNKLLDSILLRISIRSIQVKSCIKLHFVVYSFLTHIVYSKL